MLRLIRKTWEGTCMVDIIGRPGDESSEVLAAELRKRSCEVRVDELTAGCLAARLNCLRADGFRIVVVDPDLPRLDGRSSIRGICSVRSYLRRSERDRATVFVYTALTEPDYPGAKSVVQKPFGLLYVLVADALRNLPY